MSIHAPRWRPRPESPLNISLPPEKTATQFVYQRFGSSFHENLKECLKPAPFRAFGRQSSPLEEAAGARAFNEISTRHRMCGSSHAMGLIAHFAVLILILFPAHHLSNMTQPPLLKTYLIAPDVSDGIRLPQGKELAGGGGGGGDHSPVPATKGRVPKFTVRQIAPPLIPHNPNPILIAEATLLGPPELQVPSPNLNGYGDPLAKMVNDSDGPGQGGGMGDGEGTGDGSGHGPGFGRGWGGGAGDGASKPGINGVGFPTCDYCPDAKYSEEARKAKFQGVVLLQVIVSADGRATNIDVVRGPGLGLEQQAVAAVKMWRFKPAFGPNHVPVATRIAIEVQFRLL